MHVVATAGHVDHGKSTLVRALTGSDPDRLAEEHRRGLSIELGFCWTTLDPVGEVAFVDVPGHERFVSTMLAGVGPVPAVLLVVAADDDWMPQAEEHLRALDGLGVERGLLVVTRTDLADPGPALRRARDRLVGTGLAGMPHVTVSARTGAGMADLRACVARLVGHLPAPDPGSDVRLWVDRHFHVRGSGTVVTGTLDAGIVRSGDTVTLDGGELVRVRTVQTLGRDVEAAVGVARVALNLSGRAGERVTRGSVLTTPDAWWFTDQVDVRLVPGHGAGTGPERPPEHAVVHLGAASVPGRVRPLAADLARVSLERRLPMRVGDRALLRDPGSRTVWGVRVLAPDPPSLRRRGAAARRAAQLGRLDGGLQTEVDIRDVASAAHLRRVGVPVSEPTAGVVAVGDLLLTAVRARELTESVQRVLRERASDLRPEVPTAEVAGALDVPVALVTALAGPSVRQAHGRLALAGGATLPDRLADAWAAVREDLEDEPYAAPDAHRLAALGLDRSAVAALARAGVALRVGEDVVLLPGADAAAGRRLAGLPQPFTLSQARQALGTTRRVAVPLLEHLDRVRITRRHADSTRTVLPGAGAN